MKWLHKISFVTVILLAISLSFYFIFNQWLSHNLNKQNIHNVSWSLGSLSSETTHIETIEFNYNNQYSIQAKDVFIRLGFTDSVPTIQHIDVSQISVKNNQPYLFTEKQNHKPSTQTALAQLKSVIHALLPKTNHDYTLPDTDSDQINESNAWLAYIPATVNIKKITYQQPCSSKLQTAQQPDSCSIQAKLKWQLQSQKLPIAANLNIILHEHDLTQLSLTTDLNLTADMHNDQLALTHLSGDVKLTQRSDKSEHTLFTLNTEHFLSLSDNSASPNSILNSTLESNVYPSKDIDHTISQINKRYRQWLGKELPVQITPLVSNKNGIAYSLPEIKAKIESHSNLTALLLTDDSNELIPSLLSQSNIQSEIQASMPNPISINSIGTLSGDAVLAINLNQGVLSSHQLQSSGNFALLPSSNIAKKLAKYGLKAKTTRFKLTSAGDTHINIDTPNIGLNDLAAIPITIDLHSHSDPENNDLVRNPTPYLSEINGSVHLTGLLNLQNSFVFKVTSGQLQATTDRVKIAKEKILNKPHIHMGFTAIITPNSGQFESQKGVFTGLLNTPDLSLDNIKFNWHDLSISSQTNSAKSKVQAKLQTLNFSGNLKHTMAQAEEVDLKLTNFDFNPLLSPVDDNTLDQNLEFKHYQYSGHYQLKTDNLTQDLLHKQDWKLRGKLTGLLSSSFTDLDEFNVQGSVSNKSGFVVFHNLFYTPKQIATDWEIPPIYFLAGNSLEKTFKDWPKLLTIGSGKLLAKGRTKVNLTASNESSNILNNINTNASLSVSGISGIYNETTLNQIHSELDISVNKGKLHVHLPSLSAVQINHGVLVGSIELSGHYNTSLQALFSGELSLKKAKANLFNGQAWLNPQTINLNQPFNSKLHLANINLDTLLQQYPSADIQGSGLMNGELPFKVDLQKKPFITIPNGQLSAQAPGGFLKYQPSSAGLKQTHQSMTLVLDVLEDFHYSLLSSNVTYGADNKIHLKLNLQGKNPAVESGRQVNFNIQLEEDLPALITSMQISNQVSETIKQRIQNKLEKE